MRARRAGTAAARFAETSDEMMAGAPPLARRGWQRRYRCLPRAQPGPERSGGTRPIPRPLPFQDFVPKPRRSGPKASTASRLVRRDDERPGSARIGPGREREQGGRTSGVPRRLSILACPIGPAYPTVFSAMTAQTLCEALDAACERWTTRPALSFRGRHTTYGEL